MITVRYHFRPWHFSISTAELVSSAILQDQVTATMDYLHERGVHCKRVYLRTFSIDYESLAHRTAAELMISAVPRTCELEISEVVEWK